MINLIQLIIKKYGGLVFITLAMHIVWSVWGFQTAVITGLSITWGLQVQPSWEKALEKDWNER